MLGRQRSRDARVDPRRIGRKGVPERDGVPLQGRQFVVDAAAERGQRCPIRWRVVAASLLGPRPGRVQQQQPVDVRDGPGQIR